jgi:outer membrane protein OmpA-like peptidoglycan-associated protein
MANAILTIYRKNGKSFTVNTDSKGSYTWRNEGDAKVDSVVVTAINYQDGRLSIPATENGNCIDTVVYQLPMKKLSDEQFIRLDMVLYNFDKYFLRPEGKVELDKLVAYMNAHPKYRVELSSHTDSRGSDKYNMKLSKNRAKSCVDYIISKGISKKMITAQGYGETRHVNNCANGVPCTKEQHQANRRTELKLFTPEEDALDNNKLKE